MGGFWRRPTGKPLFVILLSGLVFVGLMVKLLWMGHRDDAPLRVACAAGLREPMMVVVEQFKREAGVSVELQFGGSGELAGQLDLLGADLYFPADDGYLVPLREAGKIGAVHEVVELRAGLVVKAGNPKELAGLDDLARPGLRISLADRSAAIGQLTWQFLEESGRVDGIKKNVVVTKPTVNGVVEDVAVGAADATLAWDVVAANHRGVAWLPVAGLTEKRKVAALAVMASGERMEEALDFARFVVDREKGGRVFAEMGFNRVEEGK